MKKSVKRLLVIFLVLLIVAVGLCWWQWDNITALKTSLSYSREDISHLMEENDKKVADVSNQVDGVTIRDLTDEEKVALQDESIDREELIDRLIGGETVDSEGDTDASKSPDKNENPTTIAPEGEQPAKDSESNSSQTKEETDPRREELARLIAEIYVMKSEYTTWLEQKHSAAIDEFNALPKEERTTTNKYKIGMAYMQEGLLKEKECDARMVELQKKIKALLVELGEDTDLVDDIQAAYEEEKELKKAYYLGLHS